MLRGVAMLVVLAGCRQLLGFDDPTRGGDAGPGDGRTGDAVMRDTAPRDCNAEWRAGTIRFGAAVPITELESTVSQRDPWLTPDELTIYFDTDRDMAYEIWTATRSSPGGAFVDIAREPNLTSGQGETKVSLTDDGTLAVFASTRSGGSGSADLWQATRMSVTKPFSNFTAAPLATVDDSTSQFDPEISGDGLTLYYSTLTTGTQSIAAAQRQSLQDPFGAPDLVSSLDSGAGDADPDPSADGTFIVFTSLRSAAPLGGNLWYALRDNTNMAFTAPMLVPDVNTNTDEGDPWVSPDGCRLYFSRDRMRGNFPYDLYIATAQ